MQPDRQVILNGSPCMFKGGGMTMHTPKNLSLSMLLIPNESESCDPMSRKITSHEQGFSALRAESVITFAEVKSASIVILTNSRIYGGSGQVEAHFTRQDDQRRHQADITVIGRTWSTLRHPCMTFEALRIWTHRASKNCKARWRQDNAKLRNMRKVSGGKCFSSSPFHPSTPADPDWSWATFMTSSVEGSCQLTWAVAA